MVTDPIADMLVRIKNAATKKKLFVLVPHSKLKLQIAELLVREGYLSGVVAKGRGVRKFLELGIAYDDTGAKVHEMKRVSRQSRRTYRAARELRPVREGWGIAVVSTPKGLLTDKQARKDKVGGEVLFQVW